MDELDMKSVNIVDENIEKIGNLFPNVIVESEKGKSIDFDLLKQELSKDIIEGNKEKYQLTWPGKKEAIVTANTPINKTLRPIKEKSVDFDNTQNIYIEGDNLEALKILQESYLNKIKCIYIDPPYNTGNDFIYKDNFRKFNKEELIDSGIMDENGNILTSKDINNKTSGKFHSDWLSMMYPRLKLARNLLSDDGVIFISIDDNEVDNLKKICNEIFGEMNFVGTFIWVKKKKGSHLSKTFRSMTEYVICYAKCIENTQLFGEEAYLDKWQPIVKKTNSEKILEFPEKIVKTNLSDGIYKRGIYAEDTTRIEFLNDFHVENGKVQEKIAVKGPFVWIQEKLNDEIRLGTEISLSAKFGFNVFRSNQGEKVKRPSSQLDSKLKIGTNEDASSELTKIFGKEGVMNYPKPVSLIKYLVNSIAYYNEEFYVLDFFSGSSTTAQAVFELNKENNKRIKFIMIQLPEICETDSSAYELGYNTICDIGENRIKIVSKVINNADIDYGFRVYKIDSSNIKDVYYEPSKLEQAQLNMFESNIKEDRTPEDLLTQVILDLGLTLDLSIEEKNILDNKVYFVAENSLVACFDDKINIDIINTICEVKPLKIVFRESSFNDDNDKINAYERIKKLSPETTINVI